MQASNATATLSNVPSAYLNVSQIMYTQLGSTGPTGPAGYIGLDGATGCTGYSGCTGPTGPAGYIGLDGATGPTGPSLGTVGQIDVYYSGVTYLSKVIVNSYISGTNIFNFAGPNNSTITITNLNPAFSYPVSVISWGRNFYDTATPTTSRAVGLFNQTACRLDYDYSSATLVFTNATPTNLGCPATNYLPGTETLVARIYLTYTT